MAYIACMKQQDKNEMIRHWREGSQKALTASGDLAEKGHYDFALFFGHLALEKLLKSKVVEIVDDFAPRSHDLLYLAGYAKINFDKTQEAQLASINVFNIEGRYAEEKLAFHKQVTKKYAQDWLETINALYVWLSK